MRIPLIREKAAAVLKRSGFDPRSHAGKALMDTLETYPRDELFHTPVDELAPMAEAAMAAGERRAVRMLIRRDTYGRYVSVIVYLPRDRYNTAVREKFARILQERLNGESTEFTVRINESTTARVHFVVRLPKGDEIPDVDTADLERRLTEASRSWRDDFVSRGDRGVRRGGRDDPRPPLRRLVPGGLQGGLLRPHRRRRPRPAGVDHRHRSDGAADPRGSDSPSTSRSTPAGARPGSRSTGSARPSRSPSVLPALSSMGVEVVDERPYELEGLERTSIIYEFGLRYGDSLPSGTRELFQDALRAIWDGDNEIDGFNGAGARRRADLAAGDRAAGVREVHAPGQQPVRAGLHRGRAAHQRRHHQAAGAAVRGPVRPGVPRRGPRRGGASRGGRSPRSLDDVASLDHDRILRSYLTHIKATLRTNYFRASDDRADPAARLPLAQARAVGDPGPAHAAAAVRDLRLLPAGRGRAPALRTGGARRPALVGPTRRLPHRGPGPGQGADGEEHRDRAGRRQGRVLLQAAPRPQPARRVAGRGQGLLPDLHLRAARHHRQPRRRRDRAAARRRPPRRRRLLPRRRGRQGHGDVLRPRQRGRARLRVLARRRVRERGLGRLRPQGHGHHRPRRLGLGPAALPRARASTARPRSSPASASATCRATCSATACSAPRPPGSWPRSTTATSSSTRARTRRRRTPSADGCSTSRGRRGRTTTRT